MKHNQMAIETKLYLGALALLIFFGGCDTWKSSPLDLTHSITVTNQSPCSIWVILDDEEIVVLSTYGESGQFNDVEDGWHECAAYRDEGDLAPVLIEKLILFVSERKDYYWTINRCDS